MLHKSLLDTHIAAIDIGTTKICALIGRVNEHGSLEIIGLGKHPSYGLKKGVVVDINTTVDSIQKAVADAEAMAGVTISSAAVGISGGHIQSFNSSGVVAVRRTDISQDDIDRVIDAARAVSLPKDREILHVLPQYFRVDGQEVIKDSLGMQGVRLEAQVHIITGNIASASNIIKCCEYAGIAVEDIVLEQLASAEAVLSESERELGVGILDIGGGTSDFAIYKDGRIRHSKVLPVAGDHFTNDLAVCLRTSIREAEEIKRGHGSVAAGERELVVVGDHTHEVSTILRPRAREIFELICDELLEFKLRSFMPYGLVLTGGGALLDSICPLASDVFSMPVRIGVPQDHEQHGVAHQVPDVLKSPIYATGYGLMMYVLRQKGSIAGGDAPLFSKVFQRMKLWIYDFL